MHNGGLGAMVIVALDVGQARIGVAACDESELVASPYSVIRRTSNARALDAIARVVVEVGAEQVVVGLPISLDGREHNQAHNVRSFAEKLRPKLRVPLAYADETLSTWKAEELLRAAGVRPERIRERIDAAAAAVILQDYLDQRHRGEHPALSAGDTTPAPEPREAPGDES